MSSLRFFIADAFARPELYQMLSNNLHQVVIRSGKKIIPLNTAKINWLGFAEEHNILPQPFGSHRAYRLLMEYFYFPEKFYFFDREGIDVSYIEGDFEIIFVLNKASKLSNINKNTFKINIFPVVNLFPTTFKPVQLDYSRYEYRIIADESQYGQSEIHSINQMRVISSDGASHNVNPWLGSISDETISSENHIDNIEKSKLHYITRLVPPIIPGKTGSDTMIALYDGSLSPAQPVDQTINTKGVCSNRDLPESLRVGDSLKLMGAGAMVNADVVSKPTQFRGAQLAGKSMTKLLSQLQLNQLSIIDY